VGAAHIEPARDLASQLRVQGIRVAVDDANETIGHKIRRAAGEKIPYLLVIGDQEAKSDKLAVRDRGSRDTRTVSRADFIREITKQIATRSS
jgi:threonyl-tRNA synthetase